MTYYIHVPDAGFPGGFRRIGPYGSKGEADIQATHDRELGLTAEVLAEKASDALIAEHHTEATE